jgi:hypothetical protein
MSQRILDLLTHGQKTRRVHEIIEELCEELGRLPKYREVAERYAQEGGNENTAKTQYAMWKKEKLANLAADPGEAADRPDTPGPTEDDVPGDCEPIPLTIDPQGRLALPPELRAAMLLGSDGRVTARVKDGELRIVAPRVAIRRAQAIARKYKKSGVSVVDEFLAERRAMWGEE